MDPKSPLPDSSIDLKRVLQEMPSYKGRLCVKLDGNFVVVFRQPTFGGDPIFYFNRETFAETTSCRLCLIETLGKIDDGSLTWADFCANDKAKAKSAGRKRKAVSAAGAGLDETAESEDDDNDTFEWSAEAGGLESDSDCDDFDNPFAETNYLNMRTAGYRCNNPLVARAIKAKIRELKKKHRLYGFRVARNYAYPAANEGWVHRFPDILCECQLHQVSSCKFIIETLNLVFFVRGHIFHSWLHRDRNVRTATKRATALLLTESVSKVLLAGFGWCTAWTINFRSLLEDSVILDAQLRATRKKREIFPLSPSSTKSLN